MKQLTIRIEEELLEKIDEKSKELNITRSAYIKMVLSKSLKE